MEKIEHSCRNLYLVKRYISSIAASQLCFVIQHECRCIFTCLKDKNNFPRGSFHSARAKRRRKNSNSITSVSESGGDGEREREASEDEMRREGDTGAEMPHSDVWFCIWNKHKHSSPKSREPLAELQRNNSAAPSQKKKKRLWMYGWTIAHHPSRRSDRGSSWRETHSVQTRWQTVWASFTRVH